MKKANHRRRDAEQNREGVGLPRRMPSTPGHLFQLRENKTGLTKQMATTRASSPKAHSTQGRVRAMSRHHAAVYQQSNGPWYHKYDSHK